MDKYDEKNGFWYKKVGDYYFPEYYVGKNLSIEEANKLKERKIKNGAQSMLEFNNTQKKVNLGKYGIMRLNYLKNHKKGLYTELLLDNKLTEHLLDIDKTATEQVDRIVKAMAEKDGTNEELKAKDQMKWVGLMNNYRHCAEECIQNLIYG
jgi:hypothetical protein